MSPDRSRTASLTVLCAGMFLVLLDVSIVNVALPDVERALHTGTAGAQGVVDSYAVPLAALLLGAGMVTDRFGPRRVFACGLVVFGLGSTLCALAPGLPALLAGRVVQGLGAAAMLPSSLAAISVIWPEPRERARALALWSGVSASAVAIGPLVGGLLVDVSGWRAIFVVNLPVVLGACVASGRTLPAMRGRRDRVLNVAGTALSIVTLGAVILAVVLAGAGASVTVVTGLGVLAVVAGVLFAREERASAAPLVPSELVRRRAVRSASGASLLMNAGGNGTLLVITLLLQDSRGWSPGRAGLGVLPMFAPLAVAPLVLGPRVARVRPPTAIRGGFALGATGLAVLALGGAHAAYPVMVVGMLLAGSALGLLVAPLVATAMHAAGPHAGLAGGLNNAARQAGTSLGIAVSGALLGVGGTDVGFRLAVGAAAAGWAVAAVLPME